MPAPRPARRALGLLVGWLALLALVLVRYRPPEPRGPDAPSSEFSSARAHARLRELLDGVGPHPRGSLENARVRARLMAQLEALGLEVRAAPGRACASTGRCGEVVNVVARTPGPTARSVVLLTSHYDSVSTGPGVSDDGVGVATAIEIARALRERPPGRHEIAFLFTDGEEDGLLGARAFVAHDALAARVVGAVNLEARGTSGPVLLFRASRGRFPLAVRYGLSASRPVTNSFADAVFRQMPNDTDLTVFLEAGWAGLDLAFLGSPAHYHTPSDDLAHVDRRTLQHLGDCALAAVTAMAGSDLTPGADEVWADLGAVFVVGAPAWTLAPLAALIGLLLAVTAWRARRALSRGDALAGALVVILAPTLTFVAILSAVLALGGGGFTPEPSGVIAAATLTGAAVGALGLWGCARRSVDSVAIGASAATLSLGLCLAIAAPSVSYLLVWPGALTGLGAAATPRWPRAGRGLIAAGVALFALVFFPFVPLLYNAVGGEGLPLVGAAVSLAVAAAAPIVAVSGSPVSSRSA